MPAKPKKENVGSLLAHMRWEQLTDPQERRDATAPAREAFMKKHGKAKRKKAAS